MQYQGVKILLVEDDPDDVWVMRSLLGDRWDGPLDMVNVETLSSALEACRRDRFDVILLDLSLPDSQGLETFLHARPGGRGAHRGHHRAGRRADRDQGRAGRGAGLPRQRPGRR